LKWNPWCDV